MEFDADIINMVKTNIKGFHKYTTEKAEKLLARRFLPFVEEKVYDAQGQADNYYWLQV